MDKFISDNLESSTGLVEESADTLWAKWDSKVELLTIEEIKSLYAVLAPLENKVWSIKSVLNLLERKAHKEEIVEEA